MERSKPGRRAAEDFRMAVAGALGPRLDRERFQWSSLLMLAPGLALLGGLFLGPVLYAFYIGFTNLALVGSRSRDYSFTGLENVTRMLGDYVFVKSSWLTILFVVVSSRVFSAGLRNLPSEVLEAAEVEGASVWRRYRLVILPLLRPTIVTNLLLVTILNLSEFTLIYAMTQGGPGIETTTLPIYVYQEAFVFHQLGYGTAISLVLVLIGAIFSL